MVAIVIEVDEPKKSIDNQMTRLKDFASQVEKATKDANIFILGDMNICLEKCSEEKYYLK